MSTNILLEQMLGQQFSENPQMQALLTMMQQNNAAQENQREAEQSEVERYKILLKKAIAKIDRLTQRIADLEADLESAGHFEEDIAVALGACPLCWGEEVQCRSCRGRGKPGYFPHEPELFAYFIQPALSQTSLANQAQLELT